jgi:hypothetical protein
MEPLRHSGQSVKSLRKSVEMQLNLLGDDVAQDPGEAHATLPRRRAMPPPPDIAVRDGSRSAGARCFIIAFEKSM